MRNFKQIRWLLSLAFGVFILFGCGGDDEVVNPPEPPPPPINVFGAPASLDEGLDMMLMWTDADSGLTGSYNIYRKIGDGAPVKLNGASVSISAFGLQSYHPKTLWFADTTYDSASALTYRYYIKTVNSDGESAPSDTVMCIPNTIDRNNNLDNLWPSDMSEIGLIPTFTWDAKAGAASYFLMLVNDRDHLNYWVWWLHRGTATEFAYKTAPGITYLEDAENSLLEAHEFSWVLWAIDDNNCGFAMSLANFVTTDPDFLLLFVNGTMDAGRYRLCWDQTDLNGLQVAPGTYRVSMQSGAFDTTIAFDIIAPGMPVPPAVAQDCDEDFTGILPASFTLGLDATGYAVGDTVKITYDVPASAIVRIEIGR